MFLVQGTVRSARAQQPVSVQRGVQANGTGRHLFLPVAQQLHKPAQVDSRSRQLRCERTDRRTAKQGLQRFLV